ncbi:MAG: peroxiredoxin [Betaproteobacteria bacterium RIFCSPLOWO2_12_FULL_62_13]|nr:MAG: peroxiredoxin [Betaproteobacteria bacterium RIFCSPLOWO2_12_FULL_62_13]
MTITVGDKLPEGTLQELTVEWTPGCPTGPENHKVSDLTRGKRVVIFGLPGAFTRTCSGKHLPGYVELADTIKAKKVDEIWCLSVNDAMVMGAWGKDQQVGRKVRMMADGSATLTKAMGLDIDLTERGMGVRSQRYSMLVDNGVVELLNLEKPGQFEVSGAEAMLQQLDKA